MADLETAGLIFAPHTSAGRLPTETGLRFFVDAMMEIGDVTSDERARIEALRRQHNALFRRVVEEGVAGGAFTVTSTDTALRCMHAAMSQAPDWCHNLKGRALERALDELADTLMMLVGVLPPAGRS